MFQRIGREVVGDGWGCLAMFGHVWPCLPGRMRGLSEVPVHTIGQALSLVRRALRAGGILWPSSPCTLPWLCHACLLPI